MMIRPLLNAAWLLSLTAPALAQPAVEGVFEACSKPDRWIYDVVEDLETDGWGLLTASQVANVARLQAAIRVIETAQYQGWAEELSASPERAEAEVQNQASFLEEGLGNRVRNGMPFAVPPSEYATLLAPGGGVMELDFTPGSQNAHCVLYGIWKGSPEVVVGGRRLVLEDLGLRGNASRPGTFQAVLNDPGLKGGIYARFFDLETMTQVTTPRAGLAFLLVVDAEAE